MTHRLAPWMPGLFLLLPLSQGWLWPLVPVAIWILKVTGLVLVAEFLVVQAGDPRNRAILRYRWHARHGRQAPEAARQMAEAFGLFDLPANDRDAAMAAYRELAARAVRMNLRHPNPLTGPLTLRHLTRAVQSLVETHGHDLLVPPPVPLAAIWPQPQPDFSLGGVVLDLRRMAGRLLLRDVQESVRHAIAGERAIRRRMQPQPRPRQRWRAPDFPQHEIFYRASRMAVSAGLSPWNEDPSLLPLRLQLRLAAVTLLLTGAPHAIRRARIIAPLSAELIDEVVSDLDRWAALHGHHPLAEAPAPTAQRALSA